MWTVDEARAGQVRKWPFGMGADGKSWDDYWHDWDHALHCCSPLLVDKTRRTMASNVVGAWEVWLCAGGQDPRWPELMLSAENRLCLIQSKKLEGEAGSMAFLAKAKRLCQNFERNGGRKLWPGFPEFEFGLTKASFSNGSRMEALPQGGDQIRGPGATHIRVEEACFFDSAQRSIETALAALTGGGHMTVVTTPDAMAMYIKSIREGKLKKK